MVCNTIHLYFDQLQEEIQTPILDLREELRNILKRKGIKSALIVGTPNTIKQGLYRFPGIKTFEPSEQEMRQLSETIFLFNKGVDKPRQVQKATKICRQYLQKGARTVILGCTEFAVMLGQENMPKINTIDVLVEATVRRFIGKR